MATKITWIDHVSTDRSKARAGLFPYRGSLAGRNPTHALPALPVSVCIPVRDEEKNLRSCLASVTSFSEVVVVDSRSSDATASIAEQENARVVQFDWNGRFPKNGTGYYETTNSGILGFSS